MKFTARKGLYKTLCQGTLITGFFTSVASLGAITSEPGKIAQHKTIVYKRPFDKNGQDIKGCRINHQTLRSHITPTNTTEHHSWITNVSSCCKIVCEAKNLVWDPSVRKRNIRNGAHLRDVFYEDRCACKPKDNTAEQKGDDPGITAQKGHELKKDFPKRSPGSR